MAVCGDGVLQRYIVTVWYVRVMACGSVELGAATSTVVLKAIAATVPLYAVHM